LSFLCCSFVIVKLRRNAVEVCPPCALSDFKEVEYLLQTANCGW
jgi:hypothetical protein